MKLAAAEEDKCAAASGKLVLLLGAPGSAKESFGASLAARVGGSLLNLQQLIAAENAAGSEVGAEAVKLISEEKLVPTALQLKLLERAMATSPPPHVLIDFPRTASQLDY